MYVEAAYRGIFLAEESVSLTSMGYAVLRICNYVQLYIINGHHLSSQRRENVTRSVGTSTVRNSTLDQAGNRGLSSLQIRGLSSLQIECWVVQLVAEAGVICLGNIPCVSRRIVRAIYLGVRAASIIHTTIDAAVNIALMGSNTQEMETRLRSMLTLTDMLHLTNEAIYFCTPTIQVIQERLSEGRIVACLTRLYAPLRGTRRVVRGALGRLSAIAGAMGVACVAGLGIALTTDLLRNDQQHSSEQRTILIAQAAIAVAATTALSWMMRANVRRARAAMEE